MSKLTQTIRNIGLFAFGMIMLVTGYHINDVHAQEKAAALLDAEKAAATNNAEKAVAPIDTGVKQAKEKAQVEKSNAVKKTHAVTKAHKKTKLEKAKPEKAHASK